MDVTWTAPTGVMADGGAPITGYLVEWWEEGAIDEVQVVRWSSTTFDPSNTNLFQLVFGPSPTVVKTTGNFQWDDDAYNLRSELLNLGSDDGNYVIDELSVSRSPSLNGYSWTITFHSEVSDKNTGDQVPLFPVSASTDANAQIDVIELVSGSRDQGFSEVQILTVKSTGSDAFTDLGGWFRLSFEGSETTTEWLPHNVSSEILQRGLQQLNTIRTVEVSFSTESVAGGTPSTSYAANIWAITFTGNVGKQPAIDVDYSYLWSNKISVSAEVVRGDNAVNSNGRKESYAFPGETPKGYKYQIVDKDTRSLTIPELVPGSKYYASVSAINRIGTGPRTVPTGTPYIVPPKQVPQPPLDVNVSVHTGSATTLDVTYDTPSSDGGSEILAYRVELDISPDFTNPIHNVINCYPSSKHSVYQIKTESTEGNPIVNGSFSLTLTVDGNSYVTDYIPYNAPASSIDEIGMRTQVQQILATISSTPSTTFTTTAAADLLIFPNDELQFTTDLSTETYTVVSVSGTSVVVDNEITTCPSCTNTSVVIYRYFGGRGGNSESNVACAAYDPDDSSLNTLCPETRRQFSGSVQSKLQMIRNVFTKGVSVDRDDPSTSNGVTWRVTFLDDAIPAPNDYTLTLTPDSSTVMTKDGPRITPTITQLVTGELYSGCTGTHQVPNDKALANGQFYYARVFAINEIGYSLPQVSPSKQKPMVPPGAPSAVSLSVYSEDELRVCFNAPSSNGGDTITSYKVEYATQSTFSNAAETYVTQIQAGGPFCAILSGLTTGTFYYVRVSAGNSQGYGSTTAATPGSLNPHRAPDAPSSAELRITSDTMLTVAYTAPDNDGGDTITSYRVEWDVVSNFNSIQSLPHKGFLDISASTTMSHTITLLTTNQNYYVRVFAINSAGLGTSIMASPTNAAPSLEVPGKPHTIAASPGSSAQGSILVTWLRPRIPWHDIPCSGFPENPNDCPTALGGGLAMSHGGTPITEYLVSYNEQADFNGFDYGEQTTTGLSLVLTDLTPGRLYYIRVLARNAQGSGDFCAYTDPNCLVTTTRITAKASS
eukprot:TRINITY_DN51250_c0_g1_i1.p1 TRINITY_DN51250_c0_g1~~TRINITY_DN51250_c0_g1_i1.p1  ORF type:complete len:1150 (+),score=94.29 TRINITY_DN51250_c0_g1_i1:293-3451(+)